MEQALYSHEERQERISQRMAQVLPKKLKDQLGYQKVLCDECDEEAVLVPDPQSSDGTVQCYNCGAKFYYWVCDSCGTPVLSSRPDYDRETDICNDCWNYMLTRD
jgi:formylmethanofuran dehydrogenase subunit E